MSLRLPPTDPGLVQGSTRPYFIWWADVTVAQLREYLRSPDIDVRSYWMGVLMREANSRDVWLFVQPDEIRAHWPHLIRHLGKARDMWAYLLQLPRPVWPPPQAVHA